MNKIPLLLVIHMVTGEVFEFYSKFSRTEMHLRRTFLDIFRYCLKDRNLSCKTETDLISKRHWLCSRNVAENVKRALLHI